MQFIPTNKLENKFVAIILILSKNTEQRSLEILFVYIFHRLAQAENKCKQIDFVQSLLHIIDFEHKFGNLLC